MIIIKLQSIAIFINKELSFNRKTKNTFHDNDYQIAPK